MKSQKGIIHLGLILVVLIFGIGALVFVMYKTNSLPVVTTSSPNPSPYSKTRTDEVTTNNWKTYTNEVLSFQYPIDLDILEENSSRIVFGNSTLNSSIFEIRFSNFSKVDKNNSEKVQLEDKQALKFADSSSYVVQTTEKPLIELRYATGDSNSEVTNKQIFDQILSTFEFIENSSSSDKRTTTFTSKKIPGLSFPAISIDIPNNWQKTVENESYLDLRLTNEEYFIQITQDAWGGSVCLFDDTPNFEGPSNDLKGKSYKQFTANNGDIYRRYQTEFNYESKIIIGVCQKQEISGYFVSPTIWASVQYRVPENYSESMLEEMDNIIKTLKPVN